MNISPENIQTTTGDSTSSEYLKELEEYILECARKREKHIGLAARQAYVEQFVIDNLSVQSAA